MVRPRATGKPKRKRARKARTAAAHFDSDSSSSSSSSSESDSSSDDDDDATSSDDVPKAVTQHPVGKADRLKLQAQKMDIDSDSDQDSSSSSSSSSSSAKEEHDDDDDDDEALDGNIGARAKSTTSQERRPRQLFTPPPEPLTSFRDGASASHLASQSASLEARFRRLVPKVTSTSSDIVKEQENKRSDARKRLEAYETKKKATHTTFSSATSRLNDAEIEEKLQSVWMRSIIGSFGEELDALRKKEAMLAGASKGTNRMPLLIDALQSGSELFSHGPRTKENISSYGPLHQIDEVGLLLDQAELDESTA